MIIFRTLIIIFRLNQTSQEDYLVSTLNRAIEKATIVNETELSAVDKEEMPTIPGMDFILK
ncbi:MAG: hypothetical protein QM485_12830 [Flavobacteriaceae bacterium]